MPDLFGQTQVLPSWLQDDSANRAAQGFQIGAQIASTVNQNRQRAVENQRADRRLSLEEQQAQTNRLLTEAQIEGQRLKLDDAHAFAEDTPKILALGEQLQKAQSLDEVDKVGPLGLKSYQGQQAAEKVIEVHRGRLAQKRLQNFGQMFDTKVQDFTLANGRPPNEEERRVISSDTFMRVDPESWAKSILPQQVRADASLNAAQIRADAMAEAAAARGLAGGLGGAAGVRATEGVDNMVKSLKSIGVNVDDNQIAEVKSKALLGGMSAVNAPQAVVKDIENENKSFQQLDAVTKKIEDFDKKFGKGAFNEYVGPVDAPLFKFKTRALEPSKLSAADREAKDIFRDANYIIQAYRKNNFGTALTSNETAAFREIIGDPSFSDYSNGLSTFKDSVKRGVGISIADHALSPNIPATIKKRFLVGESPGVAPAAAAVTTTTPSGSVDDFVIMVNPSGTNVRVPRARVEEARSKGYK